MLGCFRRVALDRVCPVLFFPWRRLVTILVSDGVGLPTLSFLSALLARLLLWRRVATILVSDGGSLPVQVLSLAQLTRLVRRLVTILVVRPLALVPALLLASWLGLRLLLRISMKKLYA